MDSETGEEVFPLLSLPAEIRDMIYEHVLFASACTTNMSQRQASVDKGIQIHTNILFASRQVFQEAQNALFRAQLVQVISHGAKLQDLQQGAAMEDGIPLFHPRFKRFCLLKHIMDENYLSQSWREQEDISYIIRSEDVHQLCRGRSGRGPTQALDHNIAHNLILVDPQTRLSPRPANVSMSAPSNKRLMQIYQKALGGCQDVWMSAHSSVEPDRQFMDEMVEKIKSSNTDSSTA